MAKRAASKQGSIEAFLGPVASPDKGLFFPLEVDTRMSAIAVVCCDRGMQAQFERFRERREIEFMYRIMVSTNSKCTPNPDIKQPIEIKEGTSEDGGRLFDIKADKYLPVPNLVDLIGAPLGDLSIHLYSWSFPNPTDPHSQEITISLQPSNERGRASK